MNTKVQNLVYVFYVEQYSEKYLQVCPGPCA